MSEQDPTLQDVWRLLNSLNRRMGERFDVVDRQLAALDARLGGLDARLGGLDARLGGLDARLGGLDAKVTAGFGTLKEWIEP